MIDRERWVYVVVQNPGRDETIVGQQHPEEEISFIPAFHDRDAALQGMHRLARMPEATWEVQAIIYGDLLDYARSSGFLIFLLDGSGRILTKMGPDGRPL